MIHHLKRVDFLSLDLPRVFWYSLATQEKTPGGVA